MVPLSPQVIITVAAFAIFCNPLARADSIEVIVGSNSESVVSGTNASYQGFTIDNAFGGTQNPGPGLEAYNVRVGDSMMTVSGSGTIELLYSAGGFTSAGGIEGLLSVGTITGAGSSVSAYGYIDTSNQVYSATPPSGDLVTSITGVTSADDNMNLMVDGNPSFSPSGAYSMTEELLVNLGTGGSISFEDAHLAVFPGGAPPIPGPSVPDGGSTAALLGFSFVGLAGLRGKLRASIPCKAAIA